MQCVRSFYIYSVCDVNMPIITHFECIFADSADNRHHIDHLIMLLSNRRVLSLRMVSDA